MTVIRAAWVALVVAALPAAAAAGSASRPAWEQWAHVPGVVDVAGPRSDGRMIVAARGRLLLLSASGELGGFAPAYAVPDGTEPYITVSPGLAVEGAGCSFAKDEVLALDLTAPHLGVTRISADGAVSRLADVAGVSTLSGIALDTVGSFGHRLLVIGPAGTGKTAVAAIDCRGRVTSIGTVDKALEGGIAVAPSGFGSYGGQLVAPDELDGSIFAVSPKGRLSRVARSGVPAGGDIGVESAGFVPAPAAAAAYLADRGTPGNPHPGTDSVLRLTGPALASAGVRPGDLLVATEGGATVVDVRCARSCVARIVATGPPAAHAEGRLLVVAGESPVAPTSGSTSSHSSGRDRATVIVAVALAVAVIGVAFVLQRRRRH